MALATRLTPLLPRAARGAEIARLAARFTISLMTPQSAPITRPSLAALAAVFGRYGNLTFGGGGATVGVLQQELQQRRNWITREQFHLCFGLSRLTPGTNMLAFCTGIGWMTRGWRGAAVALLSASLPATVIAIAATALFDLRSQAPLMKAAFHGALAAAIGIIFNTCWQFTESVLTRANRVRIVVILLASVAMQTFFPLSPARILLLAALAGAFWPDEGTK